MPLLDVALSSTCAVAESANGVSGTRTVVGFTSVAPATRGSTIIVFAPNPPPRAAAWTRTFEMGSPKSFASSLRV